jgi:hypothetical protein
MDARSPCMRAFASFHRSKARRDLPATQGGTFMNSRALIGLAICAAGIFFTFVVQTGYIWYGAIIWGGIMFIRGLAQGDRQ